MGFLGLQYFECFECGMVAWFELSSVGHRGREKVCKGLGTVQPEHWSRSLHFRSKRYEDLRCESIHIYRGGQINCK